VTLWHIYVTNCQDDYVILTGQDLVNIE